MKPTTVTRRAHQLAAGVRDLVRHAADSMGISIEIWEGPGRPPERLNLGNACSTCEQSQARLFDRCRKRRTYLSRREATVPAEMAEKCPLKLRLARLGSDGADAGPTLFAFGYRAEGEEAKQDERILSFLRDLRRMLAENSELQTEVSRMSEELVSRSEEIDLLVSVSGRLSRRDELHRAIVHVLNEWRTVMDGECAFLWLRDRSLLEFAFPVGGPGPATGDQRHVWETFARRLSDTLERSGLEVCIERLTATHPIARALGGDCDAIAVPLGGDGRSRGVVCGIRRAGRDDFGADEVRLLRSLAAQLGLATANADLEADLKGFLTNTVRTLVSAIDAKDSYTAGHSERVNIVSMLIGNEMNLDLDVLEALYWGSLLHDVGKIGMPESILNKPTALDETEVEIVKQHPERGWEMLHAIDRLRLAAEGVRHHHERWDGGGYPQRLASDDIPLVARIIAVADAFDAIISNRSYRRARPAARALEVIEESSGTQFDPGVVAALRSLLPLLEKHQWVLISGQRVAAPART
jgi:hypothetical protein